MSGADAEGVGVVAVGEQAARVAGVAVDVDGDEVGHAEAVPLDRRRPRRVRYGGE